MANYTTQYTFGVSADTKSAQSSLNALSKSLRSIQTSKYHVQVDTTRINEASQAAATLRTALQNAMNVDTGKLNLTKFNNELKSAGTSVADLGGKLLNAGTQGQQAFSQLAHTIASSEAPVKRFNAALSSIGVTLLNTIKWQAASSLIHGLMSTISGAITYAKNLNSTLTDIRVVTGASTDEMARFAESANQAAKALSTSTNEFAKASLIYYQQGDNAELAAKKAAITTKAANVAFTASAREMSEMLTAVWNSYQVGEDQLEHTVDVLARLGATTASSMEEMATGMQKVAATANTVGVSMEQMSAMIATSASVTRQAPQTIGTAWNTILNRVSGLKLGETLEDGVDLNKYSKALQTIGVDILDASGDLREMGTVIDEIGEKWGNMSKAQQTALAQTIGGVRQYTQIMAFFENFDKYQKNLQTANNANGALQEQQEIYAQSWEAASKRAQAALETVYSQLINDKAIIQIKDFFTTLLNIGTSISSTFGGLGNVITLIGTALVNANIDKISTWITEAGTSIKQLFSGNQEINEYAATLQQMRSEMEGLLARDDVTSSAKTELQFDIQILNMKEQLAGASDRLTKKQKEQAQQYIANMESAKAYYNSIMQEQEAIIKRTETANKTMKTSIKESIAASTRGGQPAENYMQQQDDRRTANHMVMDVLSDEQYAKLQDAAILMGVIKNTSQEVTADKLVETLQKANEEAAKFSAILDRVDQAFTQKTDEKGNSFYDVTSYTGSDEARKAMLTSMANTVASSGNADIAAAGQAQLTALQSIDPSNVAELQTVLNALVPLLNDAGSAAQKAATDVGGVATAAGATKEEVHELETSARQGGAALGQMADDAALAGANIKAKFEASLKSASTKVSGFVTTAMTMTRVTTAINAIGNAMNKLSDPDVSGWQKFTTVISTFGTIAFATKSIMDALTSSHKGLIVQTWKNMVATASDTALQAGHSAAYLAVAGAVKAADTAIKGFMASNPIGWILAIVAAVIALIAIIASLVSSNDKKWQEDMAKRQKELAEAMEKTDESASKLETDMQNLQAIMHDTSLTYEEQLTKINEICEAYGVQATMLDVLSGNYTRLAQAMTDAAQVESANIVTEAEEHVETAHQLASENASHNNGRSFWQWGRDVLNSGLFGIPDAIESGDWTKLHPEYLIPLYGQAKAMEGTWNAVFNDGYSSFYRLNQTQRTNNAERTAFRSHETELAQMGYRINRSGQIEEVEDGKGQGAQLLELLQTNEDFKAAREDADSYVSKAISELMTAGYDIEIQAKTALTKAQMVNQLWSNENFDAFNLSEQEETVQAVGELVRQAGARTESERAYLASYISGFDNYSDVGAQYMALNTLSGSAATVQMQIRPEIQDKEALAETILSDLLEDDTLTADVLVKINPTDIIFNTVTGKYTIDKQARQLAEDRIAIEAAQAKKDALNENKNLMTGKSFTADDYQTLKDSNLFESEEQLFEFMRSNQGAREIMWQEMYDGVVSAEAAGYEAAIEHAQARIPELEGRLNAWYSDLSSYAADLVTDGIIKAEDIEGLSGELLYNRLIDMRAQQRSIISVNQAKLDTYATLKASGTDEDRTSFARQLGLDDWDDAKVAAKMQEAQTAVDNATIAVERFDAALVHGDELAAELGGTRQLLRDSETGLEATNFYTEWTTKVTKAATAVSVFNEALGQQGQMSNEALGKLAALDEQALEYYTTLSSADWDKYVFTKGLEEYDKLIALYEEAGDEASVLATKQERLAYTQTYWNQMGEAAQVEAERIKTAYKEIGEAASTVQSTLADLISSNNWSDITAVKLNTLTEALRKMGATEQQILDLQDKLLNGDSTSKEKIFAALEAETNAALASVMTDTEELMSYRELTSSQAVHIKTTIDSVTNEPIDVAANSELTVTNDPVSVSATGALTVTNDPVSVAAVVSNLTNSHNVEAAVKITGYAKEHGILNENDQLTLDALVTLKEQIETEGPDGETITELRDLLGPDAEHVITATISLVTDWTEQGFIDPTGLIDLDQIEQKLGKEVRDAVEANLSEGGYLNIPALLNFMDYNMDSLYTENADGTKTFNISAFLKMLPLIGGIVQGTADDPYIQMGIQLSLQGEIDGLSDYLAQVRPINIEPHLVNTDAFEIAYDLAMAKATQSYYEGRLAELQSQKETLEAELQTAISPERANEINAELLIINGTIEDLQGRLGTVESDIATLTANAQTARENLQDRLATAQAERDALAEKTATAEGRQATLQEEYDTEMQEAADYYANAYDEAGRPLPADTYGGGHYLEAARVADVQRGSDEEQQAYYQAQLAQYDAEIAELESGIAYLTDSIGDGDTYNAETVTVNSDEAEVNTSEPVAEVDTEQPQATPTPGPVVTPEPTVTPGPTPTPGPAATPEPSEQVVEAETVQVAAESAAIDTSKFTDTARTNATTAINANKSINRLTFSNPNGLLRTAYSEGSANSILNNYNQFGYNQSDLIRRIWQEMTQLDLTDEAQQSLWLIGQYMIQGLIDSLSGGINQLESLKPILGQAFWDTFAEPAEVNSPSRLTMRIGAYLMAGLNEGIQNTPLDAGDLRGQLESEFNQLKDDNIFNSILSYIRSKKDIFTNLAGFSELNIDADADWSQEDWAQILSLDGAEQAINEATVQLMNSGEYLGIFEEAFGDNWDSIKSAAVQAAKAAADKTVGTLTNENSAEWFSAFYGYFEDQVSSLQSSIDSTIASLQDSWKKAANNIYKNETDLAAKVYKTWENTWNAISKVRLNAFTKDNQSILDQFYNDATTIQSLLETLMTTQGMTLQQAIAYLSNPNLTDAEKAQLTFKPFDQSQWLQSGMQRYLPTTANGALDTSMTSEQVVAAFRENLNADIDRMINELALGDTTQSYEGYSGTIQRLVAQSNNAEDAVGAAKAKAILDAFVAQGYALVDTNGQYSAITADQFASSGFGTNVHDLVYNGMNMSDDAILALYTEGGQKIETTRYTNANNILGQGEDYINAKQEDLDILNQALEGMSEGKTLAEIFAGDDTSLARYHELMGDNVNKLDAVASAAATLAAAMQNCADAVNIAAQMIKSGMADSAVVNSDGTVTATKTETDTYGNDRITTYNLTSTGALDSATLTYTDRHVISSADTEALEHYRTLGYSSTTSEDNPDSIIVSKVVTENLDTETIDLPEGVGETGNSTVDDAMDATTTQSNQLAQAYATKAGFGSVKELQDYADHLKEIGELTAENNEEALKFASTLARQIKGFDDAQKNIDDYMETLGKTNKKSQEYTKTLKNVRNIYADVFDFSADAADMMSEGFLESAENAELLKKAAEGNEEAWDQLTQNVADDILTMGDRAANTPVTVIIDGETTLSDMQTVINDIQSWLDSANLKVGATIDDSDFLNKCTALINACAATAEEASAALSAMGVDATIEEHTMTVPTSAKQTRIDNGFAEYAWYDASGGLHTESIPLNAQVTTTEGGQEFKWYTIKGAHYNGKGVTHGGASTPSSSSGGGGGGSSQKTRKNYKRPHDEKDRYHEVNDRLDKQSKLLEQIDKMKSRAYGKKHLDAINAEIKALEKENKLNKEKLNEAQSNLNANRRQLAAAGATFNDDGTINYDEFMDKIIAEYNAAVDEYNNSAQEAGDELKLNAAEERYEALKKLLEEYEEDLDLVDDLNNDILETQNKISAAALEGAQYKVEIITELNDQSIQGLQFWIDLWEDTLDKQGDRMSKYITQSAAYNENLKALNNEKEELDRLYAAGTLNDADYAAGLADVNSQILDQLENLQKIEEEMKEYYGNTLKLAEDELEKYGKKIDHARDVMSNYIAMQQLMGLGENFRGLEKMYQGQLDASVARTKAAKDYLDILYQQRAAIEQQAVEHGWTDSLKQAWDDCEEHIKDGEDSLLEYSQQALQDANDLFINSINAAIHDFDKGIKGLKGTFEQLEDDYAYYQETQERYLSTSKQLFEISKLTRQIDDSIADSTTATSKKRLAALKDYIKVQSESNKLTEYDVQMMELQYKHALALEALEQQKNAKSTVRLTRDENGNYGYQYTANEDDVNKAQQDVDDALQAINELAANRTSEIEQKVIQIEREYRDNLLEIASDTTLSIEERQRKMEELTMRHTEALQYYQTQYGNATSALFTNQEYVAERFGVTISSVRGQYSEDMSSMIASTKDYAAYLKESVESGDIYKALEKYKSDMGVVLEATGFSSNPTQAWDTLVDTVEGYEDAVKHAGEAMDDVDKILANQGKQVIETLGKWAEFESELTDIYDSYMDIYDAALHAQQAIAQVNTNNDGTTSGNSFNDTQVGGGEGEGGGASNEPTSHFGYEWQGFAVGGHVIQGRQGSGYDTRQAARAGARLEIEAAYQQLVKDEETPEAAINAAMNKALASIAIRKYLTGGLVDYTGPAWVDGTKDQPELMLNASDTANLLTTVGLVRQIDTQTLNLLQSMLSQNVLSMLYSLGGLTMPNVASTHKDELEQNVHITAEFPNATDHSEIEQAFEDIINMATQYANRR